MGKKLLSFRGYSAAGAPRVAAEQLTYEWMKKGFGEPLLVDAPLAALGMALPPGGFSLEELATGVGRSAPVRTIDVASQRDGPSMTLFDWLEYWKARAEEADKERECVYRCVPLISIPFHFSLSPRREVKLCPGNSLCLSL